MKLKLTSLFLITALVINAQVVVTLGHVLGSDIVNVPVTVDNFNNIGAISLTLVYDNSIASYEGLANPHPNLIGTFGFDSGGSVALSWLDMTSQGLSLNNGEKLFDLVFNQIQEGTTIVACDNTPGLCEMADLNANVVPLIFNDGSITFNSVGVHEYSMQMGFKTIVRNNFIEIISKEEKKIIANLIDIKGQILAEIPSNKRYYITGFKPGIYAIKIEDARGIIAVQKIIF